MVSIHLNQRQRQDNLGRYRRSADPEVRLRAHILLSLDAGFPWATVGAVLCCSQITIGRWRALFEAEGVDAALGRHRGRRQSGAHLWIILVVQWVLTRSPADFRFCLSR